MLRKRYRIQNNKDFQWVFKHSKPVFIGSLAFYVSGSRDPKSLRFGFVVSNKIDKRATRRNALKRQLRRVAEDLISELKEGYDIVTVVKKDLTFPYDQAEIRKQFLEGMKKAAVKNGEKDSSKDN